MIDNVALSAFLEDSVNLNFGDGGDVNARFGARLDHDKYMEKSTIAPRFSLNYEFPWNKWDYGKNFSTQITGGANRYYGRNLYIYRLNAVLRQLTLQLRRDSETTSWYDATITSTAQTAVDFKTLKVPYADEFMGGIVQRIYAFDISAKYIKRLGRDEIRRGCFNPNGDIANNCNIRNTTSSYRYVNSGKSDTDVISVSIQNNTPLKTAGISHHYLFAFDWTNVVRNYEDYADNITQTELDDEWISWNGELIRYADRPAMNFVRPWTIRLNTTHSFEIWNTKWVWNNFFRYRSKYTAMASTTSGTNRDTFIIDGVETQVDTFRPFNVKGAFNWDMRIGVEFPHTKTSAVYVNLDIYNVLNAKNLAIASATYSASAGTTAVPVYKIGRQFWIQVGYRF